MSQNQQLNVCLEKMNTMNYSYKAENVTTNYSELPREETISTEQYIYLVVKMTIVIIGFLGNGLILVVMCNNAFNKTSTSVYLSALAICDTLMLFSGSLVVDIFPSGLTLNSDLRTLHISTCWILKFLVYWSRHMSSFCLVSITMERVIAILKPHK